MKKFILFFSIVFLFVSLTACKEQSDNYQIVFNETLIHYSNGDDFERVTSDIILSQSSTKIKNTKIEWVSSNPAIIKLEGNIGKVTRQLEDKIVTLTVKVTIGNQTRNKDFVLKVIKSEQNVNIDKNPPVISGTKDLTFPIGASEPDWLAGIIAIDDVDGVIEVKIIENWVNLSEVGTYKITYQAVDKAGNIAREIITVTITEASNTDTTKPVINGATDITLLVGSNEPNWLYGIIAIDDVDGEVPVTITLNTVNLNEPGNYQITYQASDNAGNIQYVTINVTVKEKVPEKTYKEDFSNTGLSGSTYTSGTFTGINNIKWTFLGVRGDLALDGKAITFGGSTSDNSKISATISGGITSFSVDVKKEFTSTQERKLELLINGESKGTFILQDNNNVQKFVVSNINVPGEFTLEIRQSLKSSRAQITLDNLTWTTYSGVTVPIEKQYLDQDLNELNITTNFIEAGQITLPQTGRYGSLINWSYEDENDPNKTYLNLNTKQVTLPNSGKVNLNLVATLINGDYQNKKTFNITIGEIDPQTISIIRGTSNEIKIKTQGVITDLYETSSGIHFFIQDNTAGIYATAPLNYRDLLKVNNEITIIGQKNIVNGQAVLNNITNISVLGTKVIEATHVTNPNQLSNYYGQLVEVSGLLLQNYNSNTTQFILVNPSGRFELVIPADLETSIKSNLGGILTNQNTGLQVTVLAGVYKDNTKNQLLLLNPSNIEVGTTIDSKLVSEVLLNNFTLPSFETPVTTSISLTKDSDLLFGATISWTSNNPLVISSSGIVSPQDNPTTVRLSYVIKLHNNTIITGFIDVIVAAKSNYENYYATINGLTGAALKAELSSIITKGYKSISYTDTSYILDETDEDPNKPGNVLLIYNRGSVSGVWDGGSTWNKEHIWPQSKLGTASKSDIHNLRPANPSVNSSRGNDPFVEGVGIYGKRSGGWYPGDEDKGDVARIVFYMNIRWGLTINSGIGDLKTFIKWHLEDPVDEFERNRNDIIFNYQKNRNPFIDHPELVEIIFGTVKLSAKINTIDLDSYLIKITYEVDLTVFERKYFV